MRLEPGYIYYCRNHVKSFLGPLNIRGEFEQEDDVHFHGKLKVLGKWCPLVDCRVTEDEEYQYSFDVIGYHISIFAHVSDKGEISAYATCKGKKDMPVTGGLMDRVSLTDGHKDTFSWPGIEKFQKMR